MSSPRLLAPAVVLLGLASYFYLRHGGGGQEGLEPDSTPTEPPVDSEDLSPASQTPAPDPAQQPEAPVELPGESVGEVPPSSTDPAEPPRPDAVQQAYELRRDTFKQARAHHAVDELRTERDALIEVAEAAKELAFGLRFERHDFDLEYPGDPPRIPPPLGPGDRKVLISIQTMMDPDTEQPVAWVAQLPFDEYPELYERLDQIDWLTELIGE